MDDQLKEMVEQIAAEVEMTVEQLVENTLMMGVLDAVVSCETTDVAVLGKWLHYDKGQVLSIEAMTNIATKYLPALIEDGLLDENGVPTGAGIRLAIDHQQALAEGQTIN